VFQALVAAAAARRNERARLEHAAPDLRWLERRVPPLIIAAPGRPSQAKYRLYVPDNIGDKLIGPWSRGEKASPTKRTEKDVLPTHIPAGDEAVHYLWPFDGDDSDSQRYGTALIEAARSITHLGWGVDMIAANAAVIGEDEAAGLSGARWRPTDDATGNTYRV